MYSIRNVWRVLSAFREVEAMRRPAPFAERQTTTKRPTLRE
jgi:hypothetical protein